MIRISVEPSSVERVLTRISGATPRIVEKVRGAVNYSALDLQQYVVTRKLSGTVLNARTGNLRRSVFVRNAEEVSSTTISAFVGVGSEAPYGKILELGSRPHEIVPNRAKVLRFVVDGKTVFARRVQHPGMPPKPFLIPSLAEKRPEIVGRIRAAVAEGLRG